MNLGNRTGGGGGGFAAESDCRRRGCWYATASEAGTVDVAPQRNDLNDRCCTRQRCRTAWSVGDARRRIDIRSQIQASIAGRPE